MNRAKYDQIGIEIFGSQEANRLYGELIDKAQAFAQATGARPGGNTLEHACRMGEKVNEAWRAALAEEVRLRAAVTPVDRHNTTLADGSPVTADHRELKPNGQQKDYVVLSEAERAKGFVRPIRRSYVHQKCGQLTTMSQSIAETYARDPSFYRGTFCTTCGAHFPVGDDGEFRWEDGSKVGT